MAVERVTVNPDQFAAIPLLAQLRPDELTRVAELAEGIVIQAGETIGTERDFA